MKIGDLVEGRFAIERLAASGGMGRIYRAADRASGAAVAVKVLLPSGAGEVARFTREAHLLEEISHPHIVRALAHGATDAGEPYLVLEWLDGEDLGHRLARGQLEIGESVTIAMLAAEALGAAHALGVVHRDIKPSNIFLVGGATSRVKVLDFGIARLSAVHTKITRTGAIVGTLGYMAPEQARGGAVIDARADVFALGAVLYECLTGAPPFDGDDFAPVLAKILFEDAPRVRAHRPEVPEALDELVASMLAKDPDRRPRDGVAVARALAAIDAGLPWSEPTSSPRPPALTTVERRALSLVLVARVERPEPDPDAATILVHEKEPGAVDLRRKAEHFGARLEALADGSVVATLAGATVATDQAARAARLALTLCEASSRSVALVTGRGESTGRLRVGDAVDRAARLLADHGASAREGEPLVLLDEVTANLLDARFDVRETDLGLVLRSERELSEGARTLLGKVTACVGRDRELGWLEDLFTECADEPAAQAVVVTATAGIGKSRLAQELIRRVRQRSPDAAIWVGRGDSLQSGSPFALLVQALQSALGLRGGEPATLRREKLVAAVRAVVPTHDAARVAAFLGELVGAPMPDDGDALLRTARQDARIMSEQLQRAWEDFLGATTAVRPVLLVLEDLHWGDGATVRFVDGALGRLREQPWMVLALGRPEVHETFPRLWESRRVHPIHLRELGARASERLVRQVLGERVSPATITRLVEKAEGNAFYLEELIRATAERGSEALPETVVAMVEARLARLDGEARRLLRAGSVFGEAFWAGGVATLTGAEPAAAEARLAELCDRELLVRRAEGRFPGEIEFAFHHALLRDGAYAMLTEEDRTLGHRLAGAWLEAHGEADALLLAQHFEIGHERAHAARYYLAAAQRSILGGDVDAAISSGERGRTCGGPPETHAALVGVLCEAYAWKRAWTEGLPFAREVMAIAKPGSAPWVQGAFLRLTAANFQGQSEEFEVLYQASRGVTPDASAGRPMLILLGYLAVQFDGEGMQDRVDDLMTRMTAVAAEFGAGDPTTTAWLEALQSFRAARLNEDPWRGFVLARSAFSSFKAAGNRNPAGVSLVMVGMNLWLLGAFEEAEAALRPMANAAGALGPTSMIAPFCLVWLLADRGDLDQAEKLARELEELGTARALLLDEARGCWALAEVLRRKGDHASAETKALRALDLLAFRSPEQLAIRATLAMIQIALGRPDDALTEAVTGLAAYAATGACGWFRVGWLKLAKAEALWALGNADGAREAIREAHDWLMIVAGRIEDEAYRKSFLERVPENAQTMARHREWLSPSQA